MDESFIWDNENSNQMFFLWQGNSNLPFSVVFQLEFTQFGRKNMSVSWLHDSRLRLVTSRLLQDCAVLQPYRILPIPKWQKRDCKQNSANISKLYFGVHTPRIALNQFRVDWYRHWNHQPFSLLFKKELSTTFPPSNANCRSRVSSWLPSLSISSSLLRSSSQSNRAVVYIWNKRILSFIEPLTLLTQFTAVWIKPFKLKSN